MKIDEILYQVVQKKITGANVHKVNGWCGIYRGTIPNFNWYADKKQWGEALRCQKIIDKYRSKMIRFSLGIEDRE